MEKLILLIKKNYKKIFILLMLTALIVRLWKIFLNIFITEVIRVILEEKMKNECSIFRIQYKKPPEKEVEIIDPLDLILPWLVFFLFLAFKF